MMRPTLILLVALLLCCEGQQALGDAPAGKHAATAFASDRAHMVQTQIRARGIKDTRVLAAMGTVPRHLFVPAGQMGEAYRDHPLAIGHRQTISQPYIVALMTELLQVKPGHKVLEVGTGSGYQAAVLDSLGAQVFSIEIVKPLADEARARLGRLGYKRVSVKHGDGYGGWPEQAPFDGIIITAAPPRIPEPLKQQLKIGARMVVPVGRNYQQLTVVTRTKLGFERQDALPVRFVPMTGLAQEDP